MELPLRQAWWPSAQAKVGLAGSGGAGEEDHLMAHPVFLDTIRSFFDEAAHRLGMRDQVAVRASAAS